MRRIVFAVAIVIIGLGIAVRLNAIKFSRWATGLDNPPPGCTTGNSVGGCFGTNKNLDFKVVGNLPDCVKITSYECNGAEVEIVNRCGSEYRIELEGEEISQEYTYVMYGVGENGSIAKVTAFPFYPDKDQKINLKGKVNELDFGVSYIRTAPYCD